MGLVGTPRLFLPLARAISQLDDPTFRGVMLRAIAWSIVCFAGLDLSAIWVVRSRFDLHGWWATGADVLGSIAAWLLALWLFLPVAAAIGTFYVDRIALAVERRFYPWLPPPRSASFLEQIGDGLSVAARVFGLNIAALILAVLLPGVGLILGWIVAAYAIGRGLFVAVAMRRMPRIAAASLYRRSRLLVLSQGAVLALMGYVPVMNLFIPIVGVAAMVHALDMLLAAAESSGK